MKSSLYSLLALFFLATLASSQTTYNTPIIGIMTIPSDYQQYPVENWSYLVGAYVKYLQQAGAQVVAIPYDSTQEELMFYLDRLNGVLFTGGSAALVNGTTGELTQFGASLNFVVQYVMHANQNGHYYPLWGTCMGFQAIAGLIAKTFNILTRDCEGCHGVNKNNVWNTEYQNRLYSQIPQDLYDKMTYANLTVFVHHNMYHPEVFENTYPLNVTLKATTYSYDVEGKKYVSSYESPSMPIYGTQYHPEKNAFEWRSDYAINHGYDAIRLSQYLANFFVNETRKNTNIFPQNEKYLIDNLHDVVLPNDTYTNLYFVPKAKRQQPAAAQVKSGLFLSGF